MSNTERGGVRPMNGPGLRRRREVGGLSQAQVARAMVDAGFANFYPQTILKIEKGQRVLKYDEGVALDAILGPDPAEEEATPAYAELEAWARGYRAGLDAAREALANLPDV